MKNEHYQGFMERGRIAKVTEAGYIVESLDRKGIVSPPLLSNATAPHEEGDMVLFVLFRDGTGKVFCAM